MTARRMTFLAMLASTALIVLPVWNPPAIRVIWNASATRAANEVSNGEQHEKACMFGPETDNADAKEFADQCKDDRHHFRFIVSPEDAADMEDLKRFTRELMAQAEKDLGTKLEWAGVDHWNTDNPHVHVIVRGRTDDGQDLVIDRDYIKSGLRDRAQDLVTLELGPRTELDIRRSLERQIEADRWTQLDRQLHGTRL